MASWETEDELSSAAAATLPTPADTPYRTPSKASRRSRRSATPPEASSSPPPLPNDKVEKRASKRMSRDLMDDTFSALDPRRFTPTLHANLVSEILALRRDQEEKLKIIENLEISLHESKEEQETTHSNSLATSRENRSLKRQLALLEGGTSSALGELAREREEAVDAITDTRRRLETAQKKIRTQEEDSERVHEQWAREKDGWEEERRKYERKIHVSESRLKVVLDEVAQLQPIQPGSPEKKRDGGADSESEGPGKDNDSVRSMSITNSVRYSMVGAPGGLGKINGHSLADELNFEDDDEEYQTDPEGRQSVLSNHYAHMRNQSRDSMYSKTHRPNHSIESLPMRPGSVRGKPFMNSIVLEELEGAPRVTTPPPAPKVEYVDSGIQFSPPPSPELAPIAKPSSPEPPALEMDVPGQAESPSRADSAEVEANQSRKRVQLNRASTGEPPVMAKLMVSSEAQTMAQPLSPPGTPISPVQDIIKKINEGASFKALCAQTQSAGTQTEDPIKEEATERNENPVDEKNATSRSDSPMLIPSISIVPPTSRPSSPRQRRLPEYNKDIGCQVSLLHTDPTMMTSTSTQTDEIRIDTRLDRLPRHLHPSAITSRPSSPVVSNGVTDNQNFTPVPGNVPPPRNPRRLASKRSFTSDKQSSPPASPASPSPSDAYPGNNDNGPLSSKQSPVRRPHRFSSLFAGFDGGSSEDEARDEFDDGEGSDAEFRTPLTAPKPPSGRQSTRSSIGSHAAVDLSGSSMAKLANPEVYSSFVLPDARENITSGRKTPSGKASSSKTPATSPRAGPSNSSSRMRKSAMIQSGIASHAGRPRSPSLPDEPTSTSRDPPFPIPTRASSRRPPFSVSAPSDGSRSPTGSGPKYHRRGLRTSNGANAYRNNSVRKSRSAATLPRSAGTGQPRAPRRQQRPSRDGSQSPSLLPTMSPSEELDEDDIPESPGLPPLPSNDLTASRAGSSSTRGWRGHRSHPSTNTAVTEVTTASSSQASGVVDAIAQTMVGEWMFKYVRRRKSFGVGGGENGGAVNGKSDESSNDRHKRWVWLAPYERAILWSSKQPASGSALMGGKSGRKLTIQSVLDVKDDNAPPKGIPSIFNRSILILTPQRALKFTATSPERHYIWLTSLSFLAHSQQAIPEIINPSSAAPGATLAPSSALSSRMGPAPDFDTSRPRSRGNRGGIRDSIRLTKGKNPNFAHANPMPQSYRPEVNGGHSVKGSGSGIMSTNQMEDALAGGHGNFGPPLPGAVLNGNSVHRHNGIHHNRDISRDTAEPPLISRSNHNAQDRAAALPLHGRKRSNTGGHIPPPLSFRGFSGPLTTSSGASAHHASTNSTAGASVGTAGSSDIYGAGSSSYYGGGGGQQSSHWGGSQRTSEASSRPGGPNFFEAIGTVRMEAFIQPLAYPPGAGSSAAGGSSIFDDVPDERDEEWKYRARRRSKEFRMNQNRKGRRDRSRSRGRDSYVSRATTKTDGGSSVGYYGKNGDDDFFSRDDPFKGF